MANTLKLKRSAVPGKVPTTTDLQLGEIAVNTYDGKAYMKKDDGTASIVQIGGAGGGDVSSSSSSSVDNSLARFDGTTGKLIQNSVVTLDDTGNIVNVNGVQFDTTPTIPTAIGAMYWDEGNGTPSINLNPDVTLQLGQEIVTLCYNGTGSTIVNGSVVYVIGAQGQRPSIALADADAEGTSAPTLGIATQDIANGAEGFVTTFGFVRGLDTSGFTAGAPIYLSQTAGQFTATKPAAPAHLVSLGYVIKVNASSGEIFVTVNNGWEIGELHDVKITSPTGGQLLTYNQTNSYWQNTSLTAGTAITVTPATGGGITITNSAPDQTVTLTGGGTTTITGTYPNFTISSSDQYTGTVTSVAMTVPTGLSIAGSPITTSGTLALSLTAGYSIPTTASQTNWDSAYTQRLQWDGGSTNLVAATGRTSLGATTLGSNIFTITNPSAITFPRFNADNTVSALDAATFRTAIGAGTGSGTVTSVAALTLGTTGTDLSSTVATGTTTPVITLNVPTASASNRGALSSTDWSTFNGKQAALVSGTNIKTVNGTTLLGSGDLGTIGLAYGGTGKTTATEGLAALKGFATTATAAGSTTLTVSSAYQQFFTGTTTQTIVLPVTTTLTQGWSVDIINNSTGNLTVNSSGGNLVGTVYPNTSVNVTCITASGTTAASWDFDYNGFAGAASSTQNGYLSSTDWTTFNNKGSGTVTSVTATSPVASTGGTTPVISMPAATTSVSGYLTSTDWNTFNGKYSTGGALGTPASGTLTNCTGYTYANLSGTVPTWNQNTTGNAATVTNGVYTTGTQTIGGDKTFSGATTLSGGVVSGFIVKKQNTTGEGGEFTLEKSDTSTLAANLNIDLNGQNLRFFEGGGTARGAYIDISTCAAGAGTQLVTSVPAKMVYDTFTATASQTTFTPSTTYTSGKIEVYCNGVKMVNGTDVTVTSGTSVVFATGLAVGSLVDLVYPT